MVAGNRLVGDERHARARPQRLDARAQARKQPAADHDVVGALGQRDLHHDRFGKLALAQRRGHDFASGAAAMSRYRGSAAMISSTMVSCGSSRDCTVMSASA